MFLKSLVTLAAKSLLTLQSKMNLIVLLKAVATTAQGSREVATLTSKCINKCSTNNHKFNLHSVKPILQ